jgi:predicted nucleotidyltransferase component of viral defense system
MDRVAHLPIAERSALFAETAARMKATPAVAEKDFWVTWVLDQLFADSELARLLMFKGGTSLSKAYRLIERFSEDIDLILDWRTLSDTLDGEDPLADRSKAKQEKTERGDQRAGASPYRWRTADAHRGCARRTVPVHCCTG